MVFWAPDIGLKPASQERVARTAFKSARVALWDGEQTLPGGNCRETSMRACWEGRDYVVSTPVVKTKATETVANSQRCGFLARACYRIPHIGDHVPILVSFGLSDRYLPCCTSLSIHREGLIHTSTGSAKQSKSSKHVGFLDV